MHDVTPIYEELPGWQSDLSGFTSFDDLPTNARDYITFLSKVTGIKISVVGVGPGRDQFVQPS